MQKLSWREIYAGILVLLIGLIELAIQIVDILSSKSNVFIYKEGSLIVNKAELLNNMRTYITIVFGILGGILLLKNKRLGWVLGMPILLLFTMIIVGVGIGYVMLRDYGMPFKLCAGLAFLVLLGAVFLLLPGAQNKFRVSKGTWLPTLVFFIAITAVYFFL